MGQGEAVNKTRGERCAKKERGGPHQSGIGIPNRAFRRENRCNKGG